MSAQLLFLSGQISVLEAQLLQSGQLDRMIGASTPEEAFRVLSELSYAQYFDEDLRASHFTQVLARGLLETKHFLDESLDNGNHSMLLWLKYDLNNIKRAAKDRLLFGKESLTDFTDDNGYINLGNLDLPSLQAFIFEGASVDLLPREITKTVLDFFAKEDPQIRDLDQSLDRAYLQAFLRLSKSSGEGLKHYAKAQIDSYNLRSLLRNVTMIGSQTDWISGGTLGSEDFGSVTDLDSFMKVTRNTDYSLMLEAMKEALPLEQQLNQFESLMDSRLSDLMKELSQGSDGLLKVLYYFERRWNNARMIKVIMFGKFYGLEPHVIEEKLKPLSY
ncbi:MAG TPA: V-type ATPase subunit [Candidatus Gracilibacteria bacterium]